MARGKQSEQTGKKKSFVAKKSSQRNSSFYLDQIDDSLIVINAKEEIIKVNKEFSRLWGYSSKEVLGKSVFNIFPKD
jgi:PAS domain S-box-containing protein